ncbi:MAG TPA: PLP-dependent aminotransferase family protein [Thermoanaerobaculia bacterium]|jgi:GntR family transcriptional regulator/MocR family aminotransferase
MPRTKREGVVLDHLEEPRAGGVPRYRAVYERFRDAILSGALKAGTALPSTRTISVETSVSRKTAEAAYAQLESEGYVVRRAGSGTFVADVQLPPRSRRVQVTGRRTLSARGRASVAAMSCVEPSVVRPFAAGLPALEAFPFETWQRLIARHARQLDARALVYGDPAGALALREAIAAYLAGSRGVRCDPSQVIVVSSSQQGIDLVTRLFLDPGDAAWLEEPGYYGARAALTSAGARIIPVPVDDEGLDVARGVELAPDARVAYVTPSNQYPLGSTMSLERRLALLDWARRAGAWIIEDDYDSEFRYDGRPVASIQGLDPAGRVFYIGTFTKTLYPSLRLGYIVAPPDLAPRLVIARTQIDGHPATFMQRVVADFMNEGHFGAHVRRMRALYQARRDAFVEAVDHYLGAPIANADAGMRATVFLRRNDVEVSSRAAQAGIEAPALSRYYVGEEKRNGLVLGYAGLSPAAIRKAMAGLASLSLSRP